MYVFLNSATCDSLEVGIVRLKPKCTFQRVYDAAAKKKLDKVAEWLRHGGDVNAASKDGFNLLTFACYNGDTDLLRLLVQYPQLHTNTVTSTCHNFTPISLAANMGHDECIDILLHSSLQVMTPSKNQRISTTKNLKIILNYKTQYIPST